MRPKFGAMEEQREKDDCRFKNKTVQVFAPRMESFLKWFSISLVFPIICFGPILGVIAAGFIFGKQSLLSLCWNL